jgi:hypothetical protein
MMSLLILRAMLRHTELKIVFNISKKAMCLRKPHCSQATQD